jgi:tetratricopeptide (TPR) repeat protein
MSFAPGSRLGSYDILGLLGAGGMGEVYRARDGRLKREVASRFLVLELVEGRTLADHVAHGPIAAPDALRIARQIIDALDAAHEKGIVHRDLKAANVMLLCFVCVLERIANVVRTFRSAPSGRLKGLHHIWFCNALLAMAIGCGPPRPTLVPVSLPDLSRADPSVQTQARDLYGSLTQKSESRGTPAAELATAYGRFGMLLFAAEYYDAAQPCFLNAQALAPDEMRWPYYLAHLYKEKGDTRKAEESFERALHLQPDDVATLTWLGRLYLDEGRTSDAEPIFVKALTVSPRSVAVLAGLGRVALAKREHAQAVKYLEEALAIDPTADSLHSPLAIAYRGLGELDKAEPHLRQWRNREILVPDPLRLELDLLLQSGLSYELRGVRALEARQWTEAATYFRQGLELTRENTLLRRSLQHKLGTALFLSGDVQGAAAQFREVVRVAPPDGIDESVAKAHYSLAVLMGSSGKNHDAIEHLSAAVKYQPNYVEAQLALADTWRRSGRADLSLVPYLEAVRIDPRAAQARLGYAIALASLGRYRDARDWLIEATALSPDRPELAHALARLLATAPDASVRDGQRAKAIVEELLKRQKTTDLGETMAMTLAELGEYSEAAAIQRGVMAAASNAGLRDAVQRMSENLRLYERRQPNRRPWRPDEVAIVPPSSSPSQASAPPASR